ncbi:class I SAM-dependent methyltransferase [Parendozoicomonas haliclonae]|uniref:Leucine carboxyl methyltransferase n=1 Tax=Parendozoicomonas haliclonae TaxID=1960125 RepID=A0A1X7AJA5_9GAMM|nr:class I SAM-dependent methyltransferase [Parendozoicomonas haliclonae]SMA40655.1 Leucine carboxyl methyltransferase [Parendozoicomonas haliclonae]
MSLLSNSSSESNNDTSTDTSRISISALYTGHVWYRNGLSLPALYSRLGQAGYWALRPVNSFIRLLTGADIETFLLERHKVIDHQTAQLIAQHPDLQIVEIACGLSPRGARLMSRYNNEGCSLSYIEADLPDMAARKQRMLQNLGLLSSEHQVRSCNILEESGEESIEQILSGLDHDRPVLIITEGLVNYFDLPMIEAVWGRMAKALKAFPAGFYITEVYPDLKEHPFYPWMQRARKMVAALTRGDYPLHYANEEVMKKGFEGCGFQQVQVIDPSELYDTLGLRRLEIDSAVRVVVNQA